MRILLNLGAVSVAVLASGCASVSGGNAQSMIVTTAEKDGRDVPGADCKLSNSKGSWSLKTPGETTIVRSNTPMTVKCEKSPLPTGMATVESATRAAMFGNILVGGIIGAAIDHSSGAAYEYPASVRVVMGDVIALGVPVQPVAKAARFQVHDRQFDLPAASGYANAADVNAVPYESARKAYNDFLQKPVPRAFVLSSDGHATSWSNSTAAVQKAMEHCNEKFSGCQLYAYDSTVVWKASYTNPAAAARKEQPAQPVRSEASALARRNPLPAASGYADLNDVDKLARLNPRARAAYEAFLAKPLPRAFALSENAGWWSSWGSKPKDPSASIDPAVRVVPDCENYHQRRCTIYAVDEVVVYQPEQK